MVEHLIATERLKHALYTTLAMIDYVVEHLIATERLKPLYEKIMRSYMTRW